MSKLLAPNGKPSNLTAEQYKLVRSKSFISWFGDWENDPANASKVVDENGEPLIIYSGSPYKFTIFKTDEIESDRDDRDFKSRFWFVIDKSLAEIYSRKKTGQIENVYEVFLNIRNPKHDFNLYVEDNEDGSVEFRNKKIWVAIATSSNQIKLADGTNTTFDGNNPDFRFKDGGDIEKYEIGGIYQGTPHNFNAYSTEYIGTGEGNQVFGWGLYFTDNKNVAQYYMSAGLSDDEQKIKLDNKSLSEYNIEQEVKNQLVGIIDTIFGEDKMIPTINSIKDYLILEYDKENYPEFQEISKLSNKTYDFIKGELPLA